MREITLRDDMGPFFMDFWVGPLDLRPGSSKGSSKFGPG